MSDFNYQEYLRNNPLLQEEVKEEKLLTESQTVKEGDVEDVKLQSSTLNKFNSEITNIKSMAKALLSVYNQIRDKEQIDFIKNPSLKIALDKIEDLAGIEDDSMSDLNVVDTNEEVTEEATSKMKVSELKAKIKEDIISMLSEQDEEEDVEAEIEDEVEVDVEEPALDASDAQEGLTADEKEIQDSLKIAYDNAVAIGDKKLADQIGNSITFFTRSHVVER